MDFETWLLKVGKSERSAKSYAGAISGSISNWAKDAGLISASLSDVESAKQLTEIEKQLQNIEIFQTRNSKGKGMYSSALKAYAEYLADVGAEELQSDITALLEDAAVEKTQKVMLINARLGQGKFRQLLIDQWQGCALTGFGDTRFLVASHIKPWKSSNNQERVDPFNGLLLLPNLDKVFDLGYISFTVDGEILISDQLEETDLLGVKKNMRLNLLDRHQDYMGYHRENVFETRI
jgi:predicted restriction endonuclease